jgi:hypothetical protein
MAELLRPVRKSDMPCASFREMSAVPAETMTAYGPTEKIDAALGTLH